MRKPISLLLLPFVFPAICFGQKDYCKKIKKSTEKGFTTYKSPQLKNTTLIRQQKDTPVFSLHIHLKDGIQHFETRGAEIVFEDGTILKDEKVRVHCMQELTSINGTASPSSTSSGEYLLQGFFSITDENLPMFTTKKIKRVQLHTAISLVSERDARAIMNYVICMYDLQ